jgi:hypothetical protein
MPPNRSKPTQTSASNEFYDAMRRLVRVPMKEVDREEGKWQAMRERLKKRGKAKGKKRDR